MLHPSTFGYLKPSDEQQAVMADIRAAFAEFAATIDPRIPEGPDKTYLMRKLRECAMWAHIAITRFRGGRRATRREVSYAMMTGLPALMEVATNESADAVAALKDGLHCAMRWLPDEEDESPARRTDHAGHLD